MTSPTPQPLTAAQCRNMETLFAGQVMSLSERRWVATITHLQRELDARDAEIARLTGEVKIANELADGFNETLGAVLREREGYREALRLINGQCIDFEHGDDNLKAFVRGLAKHAARALGATAEERA